MECTRKHKSSTEYQAMRKVYGEERALDVFTFLNKDKFANETPTYPHPSRYNAILDEMLKYSMDSIDRDHDGDRIVRYNKAILNLKAQKRKIITPQQEATLDRVIKMHEDAIVKTQAVIDRIAEKNLGRAEGDPKYKEKSTISVSRYIGGTVFNVAATADFKYFGEFTHYVLEELIKTFPKLKTHSDISVGDLISLKEFKDIHDKWTKDKGKHFNLPGYSLENLYDDVQSLANLIIPDLRAGYIILPEVSIIGENKFGTLIAGRLDIMMISTKGAIKVVDFKTKKVENLISEGTGQRALDHANYKLATNSFPINDLTDSIKELSGNRSTMELWQTQLKAYRNILVQNGFDVEDAEIHTLLYDYTKDESRVKGRVIVRYIASQMFYNAASYTPTSGKVFDVKAAENRVEFIQKILNRYLPIPGEKEQEENVTLAKRFPFDLDEKRWLELQKKLKILVDSNLSSTRTKLSSARHTKNELLTGVYESRLKSLESFKTLLLTPTKSLTVTQADAIASSVKAGYVVEALKEELEGMNKASEKLFEDIQPYLKDVLKLQDKTYAKLQSEHQGIVELLHTLDPLIKFLQETINDQSGNDRDKFKSMQAELDDFNRIQNRILTKNREISFAVTVVLIASTLNTPNTTVIDNQVYHQSDVEKLGEQMKLALEPRIARNNRLAEKELAEVSPETKQALESIDYKYDGVKPKNELKSIAPEKDLKHIENYYQYKTKVAADELAIEYNFNLSPEVVEQGLKSIQDPYSPYYLGHSGLWSDNRTILGTNFQSIFRKFTGSDWIASTSNSNPVIAAVSLFLKNAEALATLDAQNDKQFIELDKQLDEFGKGKSTEQINEAITEVAEFTYYDDRNEKIESYERLSFVSPVSNDYATKARSFDIEIKNKTVELRRATEKRADFTKQRSANLTKEIADATAEIKKLNSEIEQLKLDQLEFIRKYSNARFSDEFYEYVGLYPAKLRVQIKELYEQKEIIRMQYDRFSDEQIEYAKDDDYKELRDIEIRIKTLRREAIKENPNLERRFELAKELFETRTNEALFERVKQRKSIEYSENPKMYNNWLRDNTVEVYHREYYKMVQDLREQLALIYGSDEDYLALLREAGDILAPHKTLSYLDPRYLTTEEVEKYEVVQKKIRAYEQGRPKMELTTELQAKRNDILERLNALREYKLNQLYLNDRDKKTERLYELKRNYDAATQDYYNAKGSGIIGDQLAELDRLVKLNRDNFDAYEDEYEAWFNLHHASTINRAGKILPAYTSITLGFDPITQSTPKQFNYILAPAEAFKNVKGEDGKPFVQTRPSPDFDIRVNTDKAYNDNYKELPGKIPLPKSLIKVGNKVTINHAFLNSLSPSERAEHETMINAKFKTISSDPATFDFYNSIIDAYLTLQQDIEGKKLGYMVPGSASSLYERIKGKGLVEGIKGNAQAYYDKNWKGASSATDQMTNQYGDLGKKIRFRYNEQYKSNIQSIDAISAVKSWISEAHYNKAMYNAQPIVENLITNFETQVKELQELHRVSEGDQKEDVAKRLETVEEIVKIAKSEADKYLYGITDDKDSRHFKKYMNSVMSAVSTIRIGFDVPVQMKNYISGNVQIFLASQSSKHYSTEDYFWAQKEIFGNFMGKWMKNFGKTHPSDVEIAMYRFFNPGQRDQQYYAKDSTDATRKAVNTATTLSDLSHFLQDRGDAQIATTVWLAMMKAQKFPIIDHTQTALTGNKTYVLDENGKIKFVSAYEAMEIDSSGQLQIKPDVDATIEHMLSLRNSAIGEIRRTQGNYAASDKTYTERFFWGSLMFFYKKYLIPLFLNRVGFIRPSYEMKEMQMGYFRAVLSIFKHYGAMETFKGMALSGFSKTWMKNTQMNEFYLGKISQASREMWVSLVLAALSWLTLGFVKGRDDDEEDKPLDLVTGNAIRILWGVQNETMSMNPLPIVGGADEYIRNFTSLTSLTREAATISKTIGHLLSLMLVQIHGDEEPSKELDSLYDEYYSAIYKSAYYSKKSGHYQKGDAKLEKDLYDLSGAKTIRDFFNPYDKLDMMMKQRY